jgi:thiol-disulfide isomerase/thioredoxin
MMKRVLLAVLASVALGVVSGAGLYVTNSAPAVAPVSVAAAAGKPYVIKLHAKWCVICRATKGIWSQIEQTYPGRVNLVVFDFTTEDETNASRKEAERLGLTKVFDEYLGATGTILVLQAATKEVTADIHGSRDFAEYRAAIDRALNDAAVR